MEPLQIRLFIKELNYDLTTVRILLDNDRIKETLVIVEKILNNIDHFRSNNSENSLGNIFSQTFWDKNLRASPSFLEMRAHINAYSSAKTLPSDEDLKRIKYVAFVEKIFIWIRKNIPLIRHELKPFTLKNAEKILSLCAPYIGGIIALTLLTWLIYTKDWGLSGEFYQGMNFEKKIATGINKTIDFNNPAEMNLGLPYEMYSARWKGYLLVPADHEYTLYVFVDDGARLIIDGRTIINQWFDNNGVEFQSKLFLTQGRHKIQVDYFQNHYRAILKLFWQPDNGVRTIIPAESLRVSP